MLGVIIGPVVFWLFVGWLLADWGPPKPSAPPTLLQKLLPIGALVLTVVWVGSFIV